MSVKSQRNRSIRCFFFSASRYRREAPATETADEPGGDVPTSWRRRKSRFSSFDAWLGFSELIRYDSTVLSGAHSESVENHHVDSQSSVPSRQIIAKRFSSTTLLSKWNDVARYQPLPVLCPQSRELWSARSEFSLVNQEISRLELLLRDYRRTTGT